MIGNLNAIGEMLLFLLLGGLLVCAGIILVDWWQHR